LLSHALGHDRVYLYSHSEDELTELTWIHYGRYLHQRIRGVPTQYITRRQEFFGREFMVTPDVLIPRPETEHSVVAALERLNLGDSVIDVGCGSGAIAATLALEKRLQVFACDISLGALAVASANAAKLGAAVRFVACDLLAAFAYRSIRMVVSNPPYVGLGERDGLQREVIEHEPHIALFAGPKGTEIYERLVAESTRVLQPGGWLILELGWKSLDRVRAMLERQWCDVETVADLAGIPRVLCARLAC
jgi:release factor glutamine methyltransferase